MKEIALHILDIAGNSINAGANTICIGISQTASDGSHRITITDDGRGMDPTEAHKAADPFYTSRQTRSVGLGLPLLRQHAEMAGGSLHLESVKGGGTRVVATFRSDHPDRQPLGDVAGCWVMLVVSHPGVEWELALSTPRGTFTLTTREIRSELGIGEMIESDVKQALKRLIRNNMEELGMD